MATDLNTRNASGYRQWLIGQQAVAQLTAIPWGHNLAIISKCQNPSQALYYVQQTERLTGGCHEL